MRSKGLQIVPTPGPARRGCLAVQVAYGSTFGILCLIPVATAIVSPAQNQEPLSLTLKTLYNFYILTGPGAPPVSGLIQGLGILCLTLAPAGLTFAAQTDQISTQILNFTTLVNLDGTTRGAIPTLSLSFEASTGISGA
jgi:hypothetical protein